MAEWKKVVVSGSQAELAGVTGSFTGSFKGDGSQLTGLPTSNASGRFISSGSFSASFKDPGSVDAFIVTSGSGTNNVLFAVSGSGIAYAKDFTVGNATGSRTFLSQLSGLAGGALTAPTITATEIKSWADGDGSGTSGWDTSIFPSIINENTPLSDVLYFLLRPYAALYQQAGPNNATFATVTTTDPTFTPITITYQGSARVPQGTTTVATIDDLRNIWHVDGGTYLGNFPAGTQVYASIFGSNQFWSVSSTRTGTPVNVSANGSTFAFGLGELNPAGNYNPQQSFPFIVTGSITYRKYTSNAPNLTETWTSSSRVIISRNSLGTGPDANGLYLATVAASTTPLKYSDAYFSAAPLGQVFRLKHDDGQVNGAITAPTSLSDIGWYHVSGTIGIASASYNGATTSSVNYGSGISNVTINRRYFFIPTALTTAVSMVTPTKNASFALDAAVTITSSSLSGAPYISTVNLTYSESIANAFNPLYSTGDVYASADSPSIGGGSTAPASLTVVGGTLPGAVAINASNGQITTANRIFNSSNVLQTPTEVPQFDATIRSSYSVLFTAANNSNQSNITAAAKAAVTQPTITAPNPTILKPNGPQNLTNSVTRNLLLPGDVTAGASPDTLMAWRKLAQNATFRTATTPSETFLTEAYRLNIGADLLAANTTAAGWNYTTFALNTLGNNDLQCKPGLSTGYLVRPGGNFGYWISNPGGGDFKYYATWFDANGSMGASAYVGNLLITLNGGGNIVPWSNTTSNDTISAALLIQKFNSSNTVDATISGYATFVDIYNTSISNGSWSTAANSSGVIAAGTAGSNPFSSDIKMYANNDAGVVNGATSQIPMLGTRNMQLSANSANNPISKFIVLIRYKGDPTPLTSIQWSVTA